VEFTEDQERQIETLAGLGLKQKAIAEIMGCGTDTLRTKFQDVMAKGRQKATSVVAQTAYNMARSGKCPVMTIFWLKCNARWSDSNFVEDGEEPKVLALE
jgi:hypothetical protein